VKRLGAIQVVDSLQLGGLESVAVNLANLLSGREVRSCLCATRMGGPLESCLSDGVQRLSLQRKGLIDPAALRRLVRFIRVNQLALVHAHGTALFFSRLAKLFVPQLKIIWHDHFGRYATEERPAWLYRLATKRVAGVIAVNEVLADWARRKLRMPTDRVWYVPNCVPEPTGDQRADLPGVAGKRIVCVANLRPEKDHLTLVEAIAEVVKTEPAASFLLVGTESSRDHMERVRQRIQQRNLAPQIFLLGSRTDVASILRACDVGVLSSVSEGMPLAILEYGMAGLAVVATQVGQVPDILDGGSAGVIIPPKDPHALSRALLDLLRSAPRRETLGRRLQQRVRQKYSESAILGQILRIYATVLRGS